MTALFEYVNPLTFQIDATIHRLCYVRCRGSLLCTLECTIQKSNCASLLSLGLYCHAILRVWIMSLPPYTSLDTISMTQKSTILHGQLQFAYICISLINIVIQWNHVLLNLIRSISLDINSIVIHKFWSEILTSHNQIRI